MENFIDHIIFVCFSLAAIGVLFLIGAGILKGIDYITKGKLTTSFINFFNAETDED